MEFGFTKDIFYINHLIDKNEDSANLYFYKITPIIFFALSIITFMDDYFFDPIVCWCPRTWNLQYDEYARAYCWSEGTYFIKSHYNNQTNQYETSQIKQNYYQWISILLVALAIVLTIPHSIWKAFCGVWVPNLNHIRRINLNFKKLNPEIHDYTLRFVVQMFHEISKDRVIKKENIILKWKIKIFNNILLIFFLAVKLMYVVVALGELAFIQYFIQMPTIHFGHDLLKNYRNNLTWQLTGIFPVLTWCNVSIKEDNDEYFRTIECILPNNVFNEKIFIGIWLILVIGLIVMVLSCLSWCWVMLVPSEQHRYIHEHIYYTFNIKKQFSLKEVNLFNKEYLGKNGIFLLYFLSKHIDEDDLHKIIEHLWCDWKHFSSDDKNTTIL